MVQISDPLTKHKVLLKSHNGIVGFGGRGAVMKTQQETRDDLQQDERGGHAPQPESMGESQIGFGELIGVKMQKHIFFSSRFFGCGKPVLAVIITIGFHDLDFMCGQEQA